MFLPRAAIGSLAASLVLGAGVLALPADTSHAAPNRAALEDARSRLMQLERDFQIVVERYNLVHERLTSLQARIAMSESEVHDVEQRMRVRQATAIELATELYKSGRSLQIEGVLSADSLADLDTRVEYLETSAVAQANVFERLSVDRQELDRKIAELGTQQQDALAAQRVIDDLRARIEAKVASQADEVARLSAQIEEAERRAAAAARRAGARSAGVSIPTGGATVARAEPASNPGAQAAVDAALSQLGKPYRWGAAGPDSYDCSGLTLWAWAHGGVNLPHNSGAQYAATARVHRSDIEPGDLLFFGSPIHHVGMYIGNGQMVEAPYSGSQVRVNSIDRSDYVGAGRPG